MATHVALVRLYDGASLILRGQPVDYAGPADWKYRPIDPAARAEWEEATADPERVKATNERDPQSHVTFDEVERRDAED